MRKAILPFAAGLVGLVTALAPNQSKAATVNWGNIRDAGAYTAVNFEINNNDAGTTYNSANLNSITQLMNILYTGNTQYGSMSELVNGTTGGNANFMININENGWNSSIDQSNGSVTVVNGGGRNAFALTDGNSLYGTLFVNNGLLVNGPMELTQNTQGLTDRAQFTTGHVTSTQPGYVPVPEPTSMALLALGLAGMALKRPKVLRTYKLRFPAGAGYGKVG